MKLTDLNPRWVDAGGEGITRNGQPVPWRRGVGMTLDCPCGCGERHYVAFIQPLDGGPALDDDGPRWSRTGDSFEALTLTPSLQKPDGCRWHGFITKGEVTTA